MRQPHSSLVNPGVFEASILPAPRDSAEGFPLRLLRTRRGGEALWVFLVALLALFPCLPGCSDKSGSSSKRFNVVKTVPADGEEGVAPTQPIEVTLSQDVKLGTVTEDSFSVIGNKTGKKSGTFAYSEKNRVVTFYPSAPYRLGELLRVDVTGDIQTRKGKPLEPKKFSFTVKLADTPPYLLGVDASFDALWSIDSATGAGALIGPTGYGGMRGLEYDARNEVLYCVNSSSTPGSGSTLLRLDPRNGEAQALGSVGHDGVSGLAFDATRKILYGATLSGALLRIDPSTGAGTTVGQTSAGFLDCLAYDPQAAVLYAVGGTADFLYRIDPQTGADTAVGAVGFGDVGGLAMDETARVLYGTSRASGELITIDPATGKGTRVGVLPSNEFQGLAIWGGTYGEKFRRGETNGDSKVNIADAIFVLNYLFSNGIEPACIDAADANDDGKLSIDDATGILNYLFRGAGPLPEPFAECGADTTRDELRCMSFPGCQ